jgi:hypothetical protein
MGERPCTELQDLDRLQKKPFRRFVRSRSTTHESVQPLQAPFSIPIRSHKSRVRRAGSLPTETAAPDLSYPFRGRLDQVQVPFGQTAVEDIVQTGYSRFDPAGTFDSAHFVLSHLAIRPRSRVFKAMIPKLHPGVAHGDQAGGGFQTITSASKTAVKILAAYAELGNGVKAWMSQFDLGMAKGARTSAPARVRVPCSRGVSSRWGRAGTHRESSCLPRRSLLVFRKSSAFAEFPWEYPFRAARHSILSGPSRPRCSRPTLAKPMGVCVARVPSSHCLTFPGPGENL